MLREPRTGRPTPLTRLLVVALAAVMLGASAPPLILVLRWIWSLL
jgi:hypothetical protein